MENMRWLAEPLIKAKLSNFLLKAPRKLYSAIYDGCEKRKQ